MLLTRYQMRLLLYLVSSDRYYFCFSNLFELKVCTPFFYRFRSINIQDSMQVASMILISWFKQVKSESSCENQGPLPSFPGHLRNWLLDLLACTDPTFPTKDSLLPYSELSRTYSKMRGEASQLLHAMEASGMFDNLLAATKFDLETLSVDDAINFASKVPALCNENIGSDRLGHLDNMESAKQRLLSTSGYLKCVQVCQMQLVILLCCFKFFSVVIQRDTPVLFV